MPLEIWWTAKRVDVDFAEMKFGETSLGTVKKILGFLPDIGPSSLIYDLGCGRGCAAFFFHFLSLARVNAIDIVPGYVATGRKLARWSDCAEEVRFFHEDFRSLSFDDADLIYACALCFSTATRQILLDTILKTKPGSYLASVGWRPKCQGLVELAHFKAGFSWGQSWVTLSRRLDDAPLSIDA